MIGQNAREKAALVAQHNRVQAELEKAVNQDNRAIAAARVAGEPDSTIRRMERVARSKATQMGKELARIRRELRRLPR